jgi:hypothetical protein
MSVADDQMNSNDASGRVGYEVPSAAALFGVDASMFNGEFLPDGTYDSSNINKLTFKLSVQNNEDGWDVTCGNANYCVFAYSKDHTPLLLDVTPPNVCQG